MADETWREGQGWARLGDAGVWLAVLAIAVGAGDLGFGLITRGALLGEQASLISRGLGGPFFGLTPAAVAALGLVLAVLARLGGLPAALRGESPATRAALLGLASGAGVLLLLRMHMLLALAPTVMAALAVTGGVVATLAAAAALRAGEPEQALARVAQAQLGLMLVAVGMGAWAPACGLLVAHALASGALALGRAAEGRSGAALRWLAGLTLAGLLPTGVALWAGEVGGAAFMYMSAGSPGLNGVVTGLTALAMVGCAGAVAHVLKDRSVRAGGPEVGLAAAVLTVAALGVGVIDLPGSANALRVWLGLELAPSWVLRGDYALGPLPPYTVGQGRWGVVGAVALAGVGVLLGPRLRGWAARLPAWPGWSLRGGAISRSVSRGLHELGELQVGRLLFLAPTQPRVVAAPRWADPQRALVLALLGALGVLGVVYCNPHVAQLGPSRVYPVDVGGLNPALLGTRRGANAGLGAGDEAASATGAAGELAPGTGAAVPGELAPGTGAGTAGELAPGTGASAAGELAPGTGAGGPGELVPGAGAVVPDELSPGTGAAVGELAPGTGAAAAQEGAR